jgi:hypothetical protein
LPGEHCDWPGQVHPTSIPWVQCKQRL